METADVLRTSNALHHYLRGFQGVHRRHEICHPFSFRAGKPPKCDVQVKQYAGELIRQLVSTTSFLQLLPKAHDYTVGEAWNVDRLVNLGLCLPVQLPLYHNSSTPSIPCQTVRLTIAQTCAAILCW